MIYQSGNRAQFAPQEGAIILGQHPGAAGQLPAQQGGFGIREQGVRIALVQHIQVINAKIAEKQEPALQILRQDLGHVNTGSGQHSGHLNELPAILRGRRIHDDVAQSVALHAKITAEARVRRRRNQRRRRQTQRERDPVL